MLTIFCIPKPFEGHNGMIQINAIRSWTKLYPTCEIFLCSNDPKLPEIATALGVKFVSDISTNEFGTPVLRSVFKKVMNEASFPLLCYVNADIIFFNDLLNSVKRIPYNKFLAIGRRTNLHIDYFINYNEVDWETKLKNYAQKNGSFAGIDWIDFFVFPLDINIDEFPPFIVGRPRWDNWFIINARKHGYQVIDITLSCMVVHENHGYSHIPKARGKLWEGPESLYNQKLFIDAIGDNPSSGSLYDSTKILTKHMIFPAISPKHLLQRFITASLFIPRLHNIRRIIILLKDKIKLVTLKTKN